MIAYPGFFCCNTFVSSDVNLCIWLFTFMVMRSFNYHSIFDAILVGIKHVFKRPVTTRVYKKEIERAPYVRRSFHLDHNKCIDCKTCMHACPCNAIRIISKDKCEYDKDKCAFCNLCEKSCPKLAIKFTNDENDDY